MYRPILLTPARQRLIQIMAILGVALPTCTGCVPAPLDGALSVGAGAPAEAANDCPGLKVFEGRFVDLMDPGSTMRWRDEPRKSLLTKGSLP